MKEVEAACIVCQEARILLTSLRSGPPHVARGELSQDLMDMRDHIQYMLDKTSDDGKKLPPNFYATPFLAVVVDPRAAGPHTLVALRCVRRLLQSGAFPHFNVSQEALTLSILNCKFEQTDVGADEAVEMAIADVLTLLAGNDQNGTSIRPATFLDAFHTVYVTRNTFVHSPAMCHHLEDCLTTIATHAFAKKDERARLLLDFLVNQLLHTPLVGGEGMDDTTREAQLLHDANRVLCLRLVRSAISGPAFAEPLELPKDEPILYILQDGLCLSLLLTGQAVWSYEDTAMGLSPGFVSLEVLSEICATLSTLWTTTTLRPHLVVQFEAIFTGFYTRALVLLRRRKHPDNSLAFNSNLMFDSEIEIILESLVDILCLHDHQYSIANGDGGALETLFANYDCHMNRSDVATGLYMELCRACGGKVNEDGEAVVAAAPSSGNLAREFSREFSDDADDAEAQKITTSSSMLRPVPAHLKELCAQVVMGGMKCLFRDDKPSAEKLSERRERRSILLRKMDDETMHPDEECGHILRDIKSKKRLMSRAAKLFNQKASRGIEFLVDSGLISEPVSPADVAKFLRTGIVVGLDKPAVGAYLGEAGKGPAAGKSPPSWERDWFHKEVLEKYCSLFRFENQSLLDGLRMFLAAFRLPGEAQQIDRILQAFADRCGQVCEESASGKLKLFSDDPKRSSDAAYLLSFSIIMLNTDQHNPNIREDRKMNVDDFIKNNSDYGRDITEKGKELPGEYLTGIFDSIRDEQIRTMGEGADGAMTVERWKDVLRGSTGDEDAIGAPTPNDAEDLMELVLEHVWKPIMSAIGALWGITRSDKFDRLDEVERHTGMLGVQGARIGMDLATEMLQGVRRLGRVDIFRKIFSWVCDYSGLLGQYDTAAPQRLIVFADSVEAQGACIIALRTAMESGDVLDEDGWRRFWAVVFELRDLKLLPKTASLLNETEDDLLTESARRDWNMCLVKGDMNFGTHKVAPATPKSSSMLGAFGRALFGSSDDVMDTTHEIYSEGSGNSRMRTRHGKEQQVIWDEGASSDLEDEPEEADVAKEETDLSIGAEFEGLLIRESVDMSREMNMPITGLEKVDETRHHDSARFRVRERIRKSCDLSTLTTDTRFIDEASVCVMVKALASLTDRSPRKNLEIDVSPRVPARGTLERGVSDVTSDTDSLDSCLAWHVPVSPANEAFGEILICEIALKNRDRLKKLWDDSLQDHYFGSLTSLLTQQDEGVNAEQQSRVDPGLEKRLVGLLRLSIVSVQRGDISDDILSSWKYVLPINDEQRAHSPLNMLGKHMAEGLLRIVAGVDGLLTIEQEGWEGLLSLTKWCAKRGAMPLPLPGENASSNQLPDDDPALQCYRSVHMLLNSDELSSRVPCGIVGSLRALVEAGEQKRNSQLSVASLDLLGTLLEKRMLILNSDTEPSRQAVEVFWTSCWRQIVEGIGEAADKSSDPSVRQHALSALTDIFLDNGPNRIPTSHLTAALADVCIPLSSRCIYRLQTEDSASAGTDSMMIEFELCVGLIFKPLRRCTKRVLASKSTDIMLPVWKAVLSAIEIVLDPDGKIETSPVYVKLKGTTDSLVAEHLQNAAQSLASSGVFSNESMTSLTTAAMKRMGMSEKAVSQIMEQS